MQMGSQMQGFLEANPEVNFSSTSSMQLMQGISNKPNLQK